jgi:hypothetical protein
MAKAALASCFEVWYKAQNIIITRKETMMAVYTLSESSVRSNMMVHIWYRAQPAYEGAGLRFVTPPSKVLQKHAIDTRIDSKINL